MMLCVCTARVAASQCESLPLIPEPNVIWGLTDSVAACPAADSLIGISPARPSRLRIGVYYYDLDQCPRPGVPPESIWVETSIQVGNLKVNDVALKTFADDSTDAFGFARITLGSFSGCGKVAIKLLVSGAFQGTRYATVRTPDPDADGRMEPTEDALVCDLDYSDPNGIGDTQDQQIAIPHLDHWHRHALHGTLVKRTNLCDGCSVGQPNTIGDGKMSWSPSGRYLSFDIDDPDVGCKVFLVPSSPAEGNDLTQFTFPTIPDSVDYDACWSPTGQEIIFQRRDRVLYRKQVPWIGSTETAILGEQSNGVTYPAVSPDGRTVAYCRAEGPTHIYTVPIEGGAPKRITSEAGVFDRYPEWSPDGRSLVFERFIPATGARHLYKVAPGDAVPTPAAFYAPSNAAAVLPSYSPDSLVIVAGQGPTSAVPVAATLATTPPGSPKAITSNYPEHTYRLLSPRMSPDGTRLGVIAKNPAVSGAQTPQVWAVQRNMNLPPRITKVGSQFVADTTAKVSISAAHGLPISVQVLSTDSEGDPITCRAYFQQDGMTFDTTSCTLNWTPSAPPNTTFHVKFQVTTNTWPKASGGTDAIIAILTVVSAGPNRAKQPDGEATPTVQSAIGPNPTRGRFVSTAPPAPGVLARLTVLDLSGRRVVVIEGQPGSNLTWDGARHDGSAVTPGLYLYRLDVADFHQEGKLLVIR